VEDISLACWVAVKRLSGCSVSMEFMSKRKFNWVHRNGGLDKQVCWSPDRVGPFNERVTPDKGAWWEPLSISLRIT